jgi:hypothetical protein
MKMKKLLMLPCALLCALASTDPSARTLPALQEDEISQSIDASFRLYLSLLLAADPVARRTLDEQWKGTFQPPGYLDRLQEVRAHIGDDEAAERFLVAAGFEPPGIGLASLDRLSRVACTALSTREGPTANTATLSYRCSVPDLTPLYARYREATKAGSTATAPAAMADIFRRQNEILKGSRSRTISGDLVFSRRGEGAWLSMDVGSLEAKLLDAFIPYPGWQQRMLEEEAPRLTGSVACDWPLHRFRNCVSQQSPQRIGQLNALQTDILDAAKGMDPHELLVYCNNQVSPYLHFEYGGLTCP